MTEVTKTEYEAKWAATIATQVEAVFNEIPDISQLHSCRAINERLHDLFDSYPGAFGIRVNPKGDHEIQVILTLDGYAENPSIKIKQRYPVPSLVAEGA